MSYSKRKPRASRPHIPGYGIPETEEGMLPWSHVVERVETARNYWVATVGGPLGTDGRPHTIPVWGVWMDRTLYHGGGPNTRRGRNLDANPH